MSISIRCIGATVITAAIALGSAASASAERVPTLKNARAHKLASDVASTSLETVHAGETDISRMSNVIRCRRINRLTFDCPTTLAAFNTTTFEPLYSALWTIRVWRLNSDGPGFNDYASVRDDKTAR